MKESLLDTDILTEILKQRNKQVDANAALYLTHHAAFTISAVSRYEVRRGLMEKGAARQVARFDQFCFRSAVLPVTEAVFDRAIEIWVFGRKGGHPCEDADILIAATALEHNLVLATGNTAHFSWIPNLAVADWRDP